MVLEHVTLIFAMQNLKAKAKLDTRVSNVCIIVHMHYVRMSVHECRRHI